MHSRFASYLTWVIEAVVLLLTLLSAWPFGSVHAYFQWFLFTGVAFLLACWAGRAVLEGRPLWLPCTVALGLAGLCLAAMFQVLSLPPDWVRALSPETAALQQLTLPAPAADEPAGNTLSLDPGTTRRYLLQLIAVLAVFCVVRNNLRDPDSFRRLAWLSAANGVLLSLLALGQMSSSDPHTVYWSIPTRGAVFGPFINRNHFAFYLNLCLGLTAGLLLGTRYFVGEGLSRRRRGLGAWRELFRDPRVLWLVCGLGVMLAALCASLCRGGVLGLVAGGALGGVLYLLRSRQSLRLGMGPLVLVLPALLVLWYGYDRVSQRWEKLLEDRDQVVSRTEVWSRTLPLALRYPLLGTGLGTFGLVEPATRQPGDSFNIIHDHAHNDYLELGVEGGAVMLLLAGAVVVLVIARGARAVFRLGRGSNSALALGGLVGFTAVAVHSFVDFGLHIPAVALFTAVVAAHLVNLSEAAAPARLAPARGALALAGNCSAALAQAAALLAVAYLLAAHGRREEQAERYRLASLHAPLAREVDYLRSAALLAPDRAQLHLDLAEALLGRWQRRQQLRRLELAAALLAPGPVPSVVGAGLFGLPAPEGWPAEGDIVEAKSHVARARRLSPLHLDAHDKEMRLAELTGDRRTRDSALALLLRLSPSDPGPWFWAGRDALRRGDRDTAYRCWRNALLRTSQYLPAIAEKVPEELPTADFLNKVLPPKAPLLLAALQDVPALADDPEAEKLCLGAALADLQGRPEPLGDDDLRLKAQLHARLGQVSEAVAAYESLLARQPRTAWRLEYCKFLDQAGRYEQARQELLLLLLQEPNHAEGLALREKVHEGIARAHRGRPSP